MLEKIKQRKGKLPVNLQSSLSECGLTCLGMVLSYNGCKIDVYSLRERFPISIQGASFLDLKNIAERYGFEAKGLKLTSNAIKNLRLPAILQWDASHFVVFKKYSRSKYFIHDPAVGNVCLSEKEFSDKFSGFVLTVFPTEKSQVGDFRSKISLPKIVPLGRPLYKTLALIFLISIAVELCINLVPIFTKKIIDQVVPNSDLELLNILAVAYFFVIAFHFISVLGRALMISRMSVKINEYMQDRTMSHMLRLPLAFFEQRNLGDIQSRYGSLQRIRNLITGHLVSGVIDALMGVVVLIIIFYFSVTLSLISLVFMAAYVLVRAIRFRPFRDSIRSAAVEQAVLDSHFLESVRGMPAIKIFGVENLRMSQWQNLLANTNKRQLKISYLEAVYGNLGALVGFVERGVTLFLGAGFVVEGSMSLGALIAFLAFKDQLFWRISSMAERASDLGLIHVSFDRLRDILCTRAEEVDKRGESALTDSDIRVKDVSFRYSEFDQWVITDLNLSVRSGEHVIVTGRSGIGKSTIAKLMLGLLSPDKGTIRIGGRDPCRNRNGLASILQGDKLYSGSLIDNITMFEDSPSLERVVECAKLAVIDKDIEGFKLGYNSIIGDMGSVLSGGQLQRVLIARALYSKPSVLVLDEATSNLDLPTKLLIFENIRKLKITRVSFTHDVDEIELADKVINL